MSTKKPKKKATVTKLKKKTSNQNNVETTDLKGEILKESKDTPAKRQNWLEVNEVRNILIKNFVTISEKVAEVMLSAKNEGIPLTKEASIAVKGFYDDMEMFSEEHRSIYELHKDKEGFADDEEELIELLRIVTAYQSLALRFEALIHPQILEITAFVSDAKVKKDKQKDMEKNDD